MNGATQLINYNSFPCFGHFGPQFPQSSELSRWFGIGQWKKIVMQSSSSAKQAWVTRAWFSVIPGFRPEKKIDVRLLFASHWLENFISEKIKMWAFSGAVWICPCLSICLSLLSVSVPSIGCVCQFLPVSPFYHFLNVSLSLIWSPSVSCLNQFPFLLCCLSLSSFLSPYPRAPSFCPFRTWLSSSQSQMD